MPPPPIYIWIGNVSVRNEFEFICVPRDEWRDDGIPITSQRNGTSDRDGDRNQGDLTHHHNNIFHSSKRAYICTSHHHNTSTHHQKQQHIKKILRPSGKYLKYYEKKDEKEWHASNILKNNPFKGTNLLFRTKPPNTQFLP